MDYNLEKGKLPPQSLGFERAVLGALLLEKKAIDEVGDILLPEMFYTEAHKLIYAAIINLYSETNSVDMLTVCQKLRQDGNIEKVGGDFYIIELTQAVSSSAHIEYHARVIIQKYIQRQLINQSTETIVASYSEESDVFELLDTAYTNLNDISQKAIKSQDAELCDLIEAQIQHGIDVFEGNIEAGLKTPIANLTKKTGGWRNSELVILAARPGMGKTAFMLACCVEPARAGIPVAIFSLEMNKEKLTDRLLSMEAKVASDKFNINGLSPEDMARVRPAAERLKNLPIHIDDNANLSIVQFQVKAKRLVNKFGIKMIVVDYLQLMSGDGKSNREQEISKISRGLKITAKELNIPIIALSQLSRSVEQRGGNKRPLLSDLRESGAIEQDADMVMFLYRPEYYGIDEWDDYDEAPTKNECEYIVAKNRNGGLVRNRMQFYGEFTLFSDLEPEHVDSFSHPDNAFKLVTDPNDIPF